MTYTTRKELLEGVHNGDDAAWHVFAEFYKPLMLLRAKDLNLSPSETEELMQDVCVAVFRNDATNRYDPTIGRFRDYLRKIITNCALAIINRRPTLTAPVALEYPDGNEIDKQFEEEWRQFIYNKALEELRSKTSPSHYLAFKLYCERGMAPQDVASTLGITEDSVYQCKTRLTKELKAIVERLTRELDE